MLLISKGGYMKDEITKLANALSELDWLINEGAVYNNDDLDIIRDYAGQLDTMASTIEQFNLSE